jgi:carbonic anhydrase
VNVGQTTIVRDAWRRGESVSLHGWIYNVSDGLLRDLGMCVSDEKSLLQRAQIAREGSGPRNLSA